MEEVNPKHYRDLVRVPVSVMESYRNGDFYDIGFEIIIRFLKEEKGDVGFAKGNIFKYVGRLGKKGKGDQDLFKALWYLKELYAMINDYPSVNKLDVQEERRAFHEAFDSKDSKKLKEIMERWSFE